MPNNQQQNTRPMVHQGDSMLVPMRVQRFLARAGVASRRGSENLMTAGRVQVNGQVVCELGAKVDPAKDVVTVDSKPVVLGLGAAYLMLNKPAGVLTTMSDPQGRPTVSNLVPTHLYPGLFPVGRLDFDTTGLLLFTTDGDLGNLLLHPAHHVWKTYIAQVDGLCCEAELEALRQGITLDDGPCQPARCRVLSPAEALDVCPKGVPSGTTAVEIQIHEGRKNQVKRMFSKIGHPVLRLHRSSFGELGLGKLKSGSWRLLEDFEVELLRNASCAHSK